MDAKKLQDIITDDLLELVVKHLPNSKSLIPQSAYDKVDADLAAEEDGEAELQELCYLKGAEGLEQGYKAMTMMLTGLLISEYLARKAHATSEE